MIRTIARRSTGAVRARGAAGDEGAALLLVLGVIMMTSLFLLTSLGLAVNNLAPTRRDQDAKIAVAAAQSGIDEYISRLTANSDYWENEGVDATNLAFSSGVTIQGTGTAGAKYTYRQITDKDDIARSGKIVIEATGTSRPSTTTGRPVSRTLTATLTPKGFLSYVYLSDVEVVDPEISGATGSACGGWYYSNPTGRRACPNNIQWQGTDVVNGPLHSNDALFINGSVDFTSPVTESSWPAIEGAASNAVTWWSNNSTGYPLDNYEPVYAPRIDLPTANAKIKSYVAPDVDGDASTPVGTGCYYQGATRITFTGATMSVLSPGTSNSLTPSRCYNVSSVTARNTVQTGLAIPPVIYVDAGAVACTVGAIGYPATNERYVTGTSSDVSWDSMAIDGSTTGQTTNYNCQRGSAFVQGTADAQVTIAANDDIVVTGNLRNNDNTSSDVIGLIAGNCVWVYHPLRTGPANLNATGVNYIEAAILALRHSFLVQNWPGGASLGTLNVTGAIAQKYRGPVGRGSSGYIKNYVYDGRLQYLQPPYFLKSDTSPWLVSSIQDK
jgi:hypothetical protein